jgi:hypothetical protein
MRIFRVIWLAVAIVTAMGIARTTNGQTPAKKEELPHPKTLEEL